MTDLYYAAACQTDFPCPRSRREIGNRVRRMCALVRQAVDGYRPFFDLKLFSFPEFAHAAPIHDSPQKLARHLAVEIPNRHTGTYVALCRELGVYVQTGTFLEVGRLDCHAGHTRADVLARLGVQGARR